MEKRECCVKVRFTRGEMERMREKMSETGIECMAHYIRKMALDGICVRLDLPDVREMVTLLRRCSNNLNQYARRANETGSVYAEDVADLKGRLDEIWELSRQSVARLSGIR